MPTGWRKAACVARSHACLQHRCIQHTILVCMHALDLCSVIKVHALHMCTRTQTCMRTRIPECAQLVARVCAAPLQANPAVRHGRDRRRFRCVSGAGDAACHCRMSLPHVIAALGATLGAALGACAKPWVRLQQLCQWQQPRCCCSSISECSPFGPHSSYSS